MRLKCIKLSGFKSFIDATTVHFPSNMCGVVGPNGCGKSNIIDAVRWVMGESSAKNLRGEAMTDVIFKGSNTRKPAAYAQVELVFDNTEGRVCGEYAAYNEISIKRKLSSDAQNSYFLNGAKCRRKDIMDIFLGTGLGPRSYSIISQGVISNLIESKPEELRTFIEEAAGISKYKERRRETENRMRRTSDNLERLTDLRDELARQLSHLEQQAGAAKKYKKYQKDARLTRAKITTLHWQETDQAITKQESRIRECEIEFEAIESGKRSDETVLEQLRLEHIEFSDTFQNTQAAYYTTGNEITKLEQQINHQKEQQHQKQKDLEDITVTLKEVDEQLLVDSKQLNNLQKTLELLEPGLSLAKEEDEAQAELLHTVEEQLSNWQIQWDQFNQKASESRYQVEIEQSRIQHLENSSEKIASRIAKQKHELDATKPADSERLAMLKEQQEIDSETLLTLEEKQQDLTQTIQKNRKDLDTILEQRDKNNSRLSEMKGQYASLLTLQQATSHTSEIAVDWLKKNGMADYPKIASLLKVESGWERAVETVLGNTLQAVGINSIQSLAGVINDELANTGLSFISSDMTPVMHTTKAIPEQSQLGLPLSSMVQGPAAVHQQLASIYTAKNLTVALSSLDFIAPNESIITQEGIWLSKGWIRLGSETTKENSVLERQRQLEALENKITHLQKNITIENDRLNQLKSQTLEKESEKDALQQQFSEHQLQYSQLISNITAEQVRQEQFQQRQNELQREIKELNEQQEAEQKQIGESRIKLQNALDRMAEDTKTREHLLEIKETTKMELDTIRDQYAAKKEKVHQLALEHKSITAQQTSLQQAITRLNAQKKRANTRLEKLHKTHNTKYQSDESLQQQLETFLLQRVKEEKAMLSARQRLESVDHKIREIELNRQSVEHKTANVRSQLEALKMEWQALKVKRSTLQEQLTENSFDLKTLLNTLTDKDIRADLEKLNENLMQKIKRLGAINLAAIEEYEQQSERKTYLDSQNDDLKKALETLESAIRKIDRETRSRFKQTFDQINDGLKALFPRVFGGGNAYLELTGEDLLETGVTIMAQPPGKKNSTIHLLSGGEKALTAIALVFAIFRLNPSPFCMLDEVDAPLDDANVGRYAKMVAEMSERVQFIYVTHNKIAMEAARQLVGITMQEAGVSRPVSVDLDKALALAVA